MTATGVILMLGLGLLLSGGIPSVRGQLSEEEAARLEGRIKAAWLYNFTLFVAWPTNTFARPDAPFCVGVVGDDPFGPLLDEAMRGKEVGGRRVLVRRYGRGETPSDCQLLFVSRSEDKRLDALLGKLEGLPILTVSDIERFARRGGMVAMIRPRQTIQLDVNLERLKSVHLVMSARLLNLKNVHLVEAVPGQSADEVK